MTERATALKGARGNLKRAADLPDPWTDTERQALVALAERINALLQGQDPQQPAIVQRETGSVGCVCRAGSTLRLEVRSGCK